jgi:hypothetical protein
MENPDIEDTLYRSKRNFSNLPNTYDDIWIHNSKCWKDCGRLKYRPNNKKRQQKSKVVADYRLFGRNYRHFINELDSLRVYYIVEYVGRDLIITWWD